MSVLLEFKRPFRLSVIHCTAAWRIRWLYASDSDIAVIGYVCTGVIYLYVLKKNGLRGFETNYVMSPTKVKKWSTCTENVSAFQLLFSLLMLFLWLLLFSPCSSFSHSSPLFFLHPTLPRTHNCRFYVSSKMSEIASDSWEEVCYLFLAPMFCFQVRTLEGGPVTLIKLSSQPIFSSCFWILN